MNTGKHSRRWFIQHSAETVAIPFGLSAVPVLGVRHDEVKPKIHLAKEFKGARLMALSPDGRKLCLGYHSWAYYPQMRLDIVETGTWKVLYSTRLYRDTFSASFFTDSQALYVNTSIPHEGGTGFIYQGALIELRAGTIWRSPEGIAESTDYAALRDGLLLWQRLDGVLVQVNLPAYDEILRLPESEFSVLTVSGDRQRFLRTYGGEEHSVECYRSGDLGLLWRRRIEIPDVRWEPLHNFKGSVTAAISANGNAVALAAIDTTEWSAQRRGFIAILRGENGDEVARLPLNGSQGVAISPDGKLLAVGKRVPTPPYIDLIVEVYDIASGQLVFAGTHTRVSPGNDQMAISSFTNSGCGIAITADGRNLVTSASGESVKVWQLS